MFAGAQCVGSGALRLRTQEHVKLFTELNRAGQKCLAVDSKALPDLIMGKVRQGLGPSGTRFSHVSARPEKPAVEVMMVVLVAVAF